MNFSNNRLYLQVVWLVVVDKDIIVITMMIAIRGKTNSLHCVVRMAIRLALFAKHHARIAHIHV